MSATLARRYASFVQTDLRGSGLDVVGFYGSGKDPNAGWVRVWWASKDAALGVAVRRPYAGGRDFERRVHDALRQRGWRPLPGSARWVREDDPRVIPGGI